jgi:hypothetical protein
MQACRKDTPECTGNVVGNVPSQVPHVVEEGKVFSQFSIHQFLDRSNYTIQTKIAH